jgi:hypothetical protein
MNVVEPARCMPCPEFISKLAMANFRAQVAGGSRRRVQKIQREFCYSNRISSCRARTSSELAYASQSSAILRSMADVRGYDAATFAHLLRETE